MMAAAQVLVDESIRCAYCLEDSQEMKDPRVLPCEHVYCLHCMKDEVKSQPFIKCPLCRTTFTISGFGCLDNLPIAKIPQSPPGGADAVHNLDCDSCTKKGRRVVAHSYCHECSTKMCLQHEEFHRDFMSTATHEVIDIQDYAMRKEKLTRRFCPNHSCYELDGVCTQCHSLNCVACRSHFMDQTHKFDCPKGGKHQTQPLSELVKKLEPNLKDAGKSIENCKVCIKQALRDAEVKYTEMDLHVTQLLETLRETCEQQIQAIKLQYDGMKEQMIAAREDNLQRKLKHQEKLHLRLSRLMELSMELESTNSHHPADVVFVADALLSNVSKSVTALLAPIALTAIKLSHKGYQRNVEFEVEVLATDVSSSGTMEVPMPHPLKPESPEKLLGLPDLSQEFHVFRVPSVESHLSTLPAVIRVDELPVLADDGFTESKDTHTDTDTDFTEHVKAYISHEKLISKYSYFGICMDSEQAIVASRDKAIDFIRDDEVSSVRCPNYCVTGVCEADGGVYAILELNERREIRKIESNGICPLRWFLPNSSSQPVNLAALDGEILVPDPEKCQVLIYSLSGRRVGTVEVDVSEIDSPNGICAAEGLVLLSNFDHNTVAAYRPDNWRHLWSYKGVKKPTRVAVDKWNRIWVPSYCDDKIHILSRDGDLINKVKVKTTGCHTVFINNDLLMVAARGNQGLHQYRIRNENKNSSLEFGEGTSFILNLLRN